MTRIYIVLEVGNGEVNVVEVLGMLDNLSFLY